MKPAKRTTSTILAVVVASTLFTGGVTSSVNAQSNSGVPSSVTTPDKVETRIGTLDFYDGQPSKATLEKVYDNLDFTHAMRAFTDTLQGVSIHAVREGIASVGAKDNEAIVFSELMDASSLFLTANADTIYIIGGLDLSKGPMVIEVPPQVLGTVQDAWFRWVIDKGKPFAPDARMKKILREALLVANATSRSLFMNPRDRSWYYYEGANWQNMLFATGYEFETPIPMVTKEGVKPFPTTGFRQLDAREAFFYGVTGITPAMAMRLPGIGSTYLWTMVDSDNNYFDGSKSYKVTLPPGIPAEKFWSFTLYDTMTRSMLATPQRYPRAGSQSYPSPAAEPNADGSTTVYFGPQQPDGVKRGTGSRPFPARASSHACVSTARSNRSSASSGSRPRSSSSGNHNSVLNLAIRTTHSEGTSSA